VWEIQSANGSLNSQQESVLESPDCQNVPEGLTGYVHLFQKSRGLMRTEFCSYRLGQHTHRDNRSQSKPWKIIRG
jgi:hypothetical protein